MDEAPANTTFCRPVGADLAAFLREQRARGFRYRRAEQRLHEFDRFLQAGGLASAELPKHLVEEWITGRPGERPRTHGGRLTFVRQIAAYLERRGCPAYMAPSTRAPGTSRPFAARIFSHKEIKTLLKAADQIPFSRCSPRRHIVLPELFRVLYGCGLRLGEALRLTVAEVDLDEAVLHINDGKFRRDRLVPIATTLAERLRRYEARIGPRDPEEIFFPSPRGGHYSHPGIYAAFRGILRQCGIPHLGRGRGPRVHDIRHSFAVHRLELWYRQGVNLSSKMPLLATYMGHRTLRGTQEYLQLTEAVFAQVALRSDVQFGQVIPGRTRP